MKDDDYWTKEISTVEPLKKKKKNRKTSQNQKIKQIIQKTTPPPPSKMSERDLFLNISEESPKYFKKYTVQSIIDLHGFTRKEAEYKLITFFKNAQIRQYKIVLVITGKGKTSNNDEGIIKKYTREWFKTHPEYIISYSAAEQKDGGTGAFYVHVRKLRL